MSLGILKFLLVQLALLQVSTEPTATSAAPVKIIGKTMGTHFAVTVSELPEGVTQEQITVTIHERLDAINQQMSTWIPESEISRFNQTDSSDWFPVSAEFFEVTREAQRIYKLTDGAFDPTVSPVIDLWGFGDKRPKNIPTDDQIKEALASIGMSNIELQANPTALRKTKPEIQLNLSAIAKGYAVDDLARTLQKLQVASFLVDIGGETRAGSKKPDGTLWKLGIESALGGLQQIVSLTNESMATSGDYRNFFQIDGKRFSHAINPVTGRPVLNPPASVSVRHTSCMTADAFATAFMVMDADKAIKLAATEQLSVLFQRINGSGSIETVGTGLLSSDSTVSSQQPVNPSQANPDKEQRSLIWVPFVAAAVIFLLAVGAMSLGTMIQNRQIKGSCGGLASMPGHDGTSACDMCSIPRDQCSNSEVRERIKAMADESAHAQSKQV
ncbi:MAG: FAD:protein FMN transferase [Fuerstiella sp.]